VPGPMDPNLYPAIAADAAQRGIRQATGILPWPLSWIVDRLQGDRLEAVKVATRANPYAVVPSGTQLGIAQAQGARRGLRGGLSGLAGSEAEWDSDQGASTIGRLPGPLLQDVGAGMPLPPSRVWPWTHYHPRDANTTRGYTGPVLTPGELIKWGNGIRFGAPRILAGTLLPPGARTPTPREMTAAYAVQHPQDQRVDDPYNAPEESW
jgi:hypothetical protein